MVAILGTLLTLFIFCFTVCDGRMQDEASRKEYIDELRDRGPKRIRRYYLSRLEKGLGKLGDYKLNLRYGKLALLSGGGGGYWLTTSILGTESSR